MKKFSAILICLLMIVTCGLAGCASFSINKVKYYNEVLATVDETKITRFDLLSAYNSYGNSYYVQQMGQSESEALNSTLDLLIDRELMYQYALDAGNTYKPTAYQVNEIVKEMFDSIDGQMKEYVETAKNILNIDFKDPRSAATGFITFLMMIITYSISNGIMIGAITYVAISLITRKFTKKDIIITIIAILGVFRFAFISM